MRRLLLAYVLVCAAVIASWQCFSQTNNLLLLGIGGPKAGGGGPFALDGTPVCANSGGTNALALSGFSTTYSDDIVYVTLSTNGGPTTSISGVGGVTFAERVQENSSGTQYDSIWTGKAASPLSSVTATVNTTTSTLSLPASSPSVAHTIPRHMTQA